MTKRTSDRPGRVTGRTMAWPLTGFVLGMAVLALAVLSGSRTPGGPTPGTSLPVVGASASTAPAFTLPTVGGGTLSSGSERGRVLVLNFTAPDCPTCAKQIPILDAAAARFASAGVTVAIVDVSGLDDDGLLADAYREYGWTERVSIGKDLTFAVAQAFRVTNMGETVIIGREGTISWQGVWESNLAQPIERALGS